MAMTRKRMTLESPTVTIHVNEHRAEGSTATLTAYRTKRDGSLEEWKIDFGELGVFELACLGKSAVSALRKVRLSQDTRVKARIEFATGWNEGEART